MTTSGSATYNPVRDQIVNRALRMVGAYASSDSARPEQVSDATDALNMMLKAWQIENHLWLKKFAVLTLVNGQNSYQLGAGSSDICVYQGTATAVDRPTRIFSATRKQSSGSEVSIISTSRSDFHALPNKATQGRVVQYYYDPQLVLGVFSVWPTPDVSGDTIILSLDRPLQDVLADTDTYDMPQEWTDCLCYGLALRIAPEYGLSLSERQLLAQEYTAFKQPLLDYDRENTSVFFTRSRY